MGNCGRLVSVPASPRPRYRAFRLSPPSAGRVLAAALPGMASGQVVDAARLSNASSAFIDMNLIPGQPCVASIYQLDPLVRRAGSLQLTADGRAAQGAHA